jgi:hypothetical protein
MAIRLLHRVERGFDTRDTLFADVVCTRSISSPQVNETSCTRTAKVWLHRPDKLVWISTGADPWSVLSDGRKIVSYLPDHHCFTLRMFTPAMLDTELLTFCGSYGMVLTHALCPTARGNVPVTLTRGEDLGMETISGMQLRHARFGNESGLCDVWSDDSRLPIFIHETITGITSIQLDVALSWKPEQPIPENTFVILPPEDAMRVETLPALDPCEAADEPTTASETSGHI